MIKKLNYFKDLAKKIKYTIPSDVAHKMTELEKLITKQISKRKSAYSSLHRREVLSGIDDDNRIAKTNSGNRAKFFRVTSYRRDYEDIDKSLAQNAKDFKALYDFFLYDDDNNEIIIKKMKKCLEEIGKSEKGDIVTTNGSAGKDQPPKKSTSTKLKVPRLNLATEVSSKTWEMLSNAKFIDQDLDFAKDSGLAKYANYVKLLKQSLDKTNILSDLHQSQKNMRDIVKKWDKNIQDANSLATNATYHYKSFREFSKRCRAILAQTQSMRKRTDKDRVLRTQFAAAESSLKTQVDRLDTYEEKLKKSIGIFRYGETGGNSVGDDIKFTIQNETIEIPREVKQSLSEMLLACSKLKRYAHKLVSDIRRSAETKDVYKSGAMWAEAHQSLLSDITKRQNSKVEEFLKATETHFSDKERVDELNKAKGAIMNIQEVFSRTSTLGIDKSLSDIEKLFTEYKHRHSFMGRLRRLAPYAGMVIGLSEKMASLALNAV